MEGRLSIPFFDFALRRTSAGRNKDHWGAGSGGLGTVDQHPLDPVVSYLLHLEVQATRLYVGTAPIFRNGAEAAEHHPAHGVVVRVLRGIESQLFRQSVNAEAAAAPPDTVLQMFQLRGSAGSNSS